MTEPKPEPLCIQWKRAAQVKWYERVKDMTREERLAYYEELNRKYIPGYAEKHDAEGAEAQRKPVEVG